MKDYVVYHNPDAMGFELTTSDNRSIVTDKTVGDVRGNRVWLLTGKGTPRTFLLHSYFLVDDIEQETTTVPNPVDWHWHGFRSDACFE